MQFYTQVLLCGAVVVFTVDGFATVARDDTAYGTVARDATTQETDRTEVDQQIAIDAAETDAAEVGSGFQEEAPGLVGDCCASTSIIDPETKQLIPMNMAPLDIRVQFPDSWLARKLQNEPVYKVFETRAQFETALQEADQTKAPVIGDLRGEDLRNEMKKLHVQDISNGKHTVYTEIQEGAGGPGEIIWGQTYPDVMATEPLVNPNATSADKDALFPLSVKIGKSAHHWNYVNPKNKVECEGLTHYSGGTSVRVCCEVQDHTRFGIPPHHANVLKGRCDEELMTREIYTGDAEWTKVTRKKK